MSFKSILSLALAGLLQMTAVGAVLADEPPVATDVTGEPSTVDLASRVASLDELAAISGGANAAIILTNQDLTAVNAGNEINAAAVGSGGISVSDSAFANFAGIGNVTMNTGHNNNLQSSLSVAIIITN